MSEQEYGGAHRPGGWTDGKMDSKTVSYLMDGQTHQK